MNRRQVLGGIAGALAGRGALRGADLCGCAPLAQAALGSEAFALGQKRVKITDMKVFGVSLTPDSDRPYVFVKLETDQGVTGCGPSG